MLFLKLYLVVLIIFSSIDLLWLGLLAKNFYREQIGFLMLDEIKKAPAILFYLIYLAGVTFFALLPAVKESSWTYALLYGSLFGFFCYATYDLTNLATLKGWPVKLVVVDLLWGTFITGSTTLIAFWVANHWKNSF